MKLTEAERALFLAEAHNLVDKFFPALFDIEVSKLGNYAPLVKMVADVLKAPMIAKEDAVIDAALAPAVGV